MPSSGHLKTFVARLHLQCAQPDLLVLLQEYALKLEYDRFHVRKLQKELAAAEQRACKAEAAFAGLLEAQADSQGAAAQVSSSQG